MSIRLMSQVWELDLPAGEKMTLLALADWANDDGTSIFPSQARLADKTGHSDRTIRRHLTDFEAAGLLEEVGRRGKTGQIVEWAMHLEGGHDDQVKVDMVSDVSISKNPPVQIDDPHSSDRRASAATEYTAPITDDTPLPALNGPLTTPMDELVGLFGEPAAKQHGTWARFQRIVSLASGHPPGEITRRARNHSAGLGFALTIGSLEKRWDELGGVAAEANTLTLGERKEMLAKARREEWYADRIAEEAQG